MYRATILLSSTLTPTQEDLCLTFLGMLASLQCQQQSDLANAIYEKLETYWNRHLSNSSAISAILDPRYKLTTFYDQEEHKNYINYLQTLFSSYISNSQITPNTTNATSQDSRTYFLNMINNSQDYAESQEYDEINNYLNTPCDINADLLV
jgi:hypothetical protein